MTPHRLAAELGLDPADPTVLATCTLLACNINAARNAPALPDARNPSDRSTTSTPPVE